MCRKISLLYICYAVFTITVGAQSGPNNNITSHNSDSTQLQILIKEINDLKLQLQSQQYTSSAKFINASLFLDAAISSASNLQALVLKESYRNKIASLNNPTSNELGFNLEMEIKNSLKPLLAKCKKTNPTKFEQVIGSFVNKGKTAISLFPAGNVFTSILSMAGKLTVDEKAIDQQDLDNFIKSIEKYFNQYERLYQSNLTFNSDMEKLKVRLTLLQDDIKLLMQDLIIAVDKTKKRDQLKSLSAEELMLKYLESSKIQEQLSKTGGTAQFPIDDIKSCKDIANNIKRIYDEYATIYSSNFKEIKSIISDTKSVSTGVNTVQLNKTIKDLEALYTESKNMDTDNLRLKTLFERLEAISS